MRERFFTITMRARNGAKLYLDLMAGKPTWTKYKSEAACWNSEVSAKRFAEDWFKSFDKWEIELIEFEIAL